MVHAHALQALVDHQRALAEEVMGQRLSGHLANRERKVGPRLVQARGVGGAVDPRDQPGLGA
jgi:hypothetical protein